MNGPKSDEIAQAILAHGNLIGKNLVLLKQFMESQRKQQEDFLAEQQKISAAALSKSHRSTLMAAIAAGLSAVGTLVQAYLALTA